MPNSRAIPAIAEQHSASNVQSGNGCHWWVRHVRTAVRIDDGKVERGRIGGEVDDLLGAGRPHRHLKTVMARCPVRYDSAMTKRHDAPAPPLPKLPGLAARE